MHLKDENGMLSKDDTDKFEIDCNSILINYAPLVKKLSDGPGKTLRKNRLIKGLEIEELASLCGLSVITMKYYDNGKRSLLSMDTIAALKLSCLFDITIEDIIGNNMDDE